MYSVEVYAAVRQFVVVEGRSRREAARVFGLNRETVAKICRFSGNCSPRAGSYAVVGSGVPWSVSLIARRIGVPRRRAVSMTDRTLA